MARAPAKEKKKKRKIQVHFEFCVVLAITVNIISFAVLYVCFRQNHTYTNHLLWVLEGAASLHVAQLSNRPFGFKFNEINILQVSNVFLLPTKIALHAESVELNRETH